MIELIDVPDASASNTGQRPPGWSTSRPPERPGTRPGPVQNGPTRAQPRQGRARSPREPLPQGTARPEAAAQNGSSRPALQLTFTPDRRRGPPAPRPIRAQAPPPPTRAANPRPRGARAEPRDGAAAGAPRAPPAGPGAQRPPAPPAVGRGTTTTTAVAAAHTAGHAPPRAPGLQRCPHLFPNVAPPPRAASRAPDALSPPRRLTVPAYPASQPRASAVPHRERAPPPRTHSRKRAPPPRTPSRESAPPPRTHSRERALPPRTHSRERALPRCAPREPPPPGPESVGRARCVGAERSGASRSGAARSGLSAAGRAASAAQNKGAGGACDLRATAHDVTGSARPWEL
ncbi:basic salivary proline-rich protein 2-like [Vidua chalybeata]|uniref:basic salivary proline-rich protein 2-like n=1 Tax=Vidua chalybeata TaxID=81927 RepID=UPI0023A8CDC5|nr:basic salivary proline-rich protein 2-like [Vidua chalybeata]